MEGDVGDGQQEVGDDSDVLALAKGRFGRGPE